MAQFKEEESREILRNLPIYGSIALFGSLGIGKGLFLRELTKRSSANLKIIYINLTGVMPPKEENFYKLLLLNLGQKLTSSDRQEIFFILKESINREVTAQPLAFIFDSADELLDDEGMEIFKKLKTLEEENRTKLFYLFALKDPKSKLKELFNNNPTAQNLLGRKIFDLKPLSWGDAFTFLQDFSEKEELSRFDDDVIKKIYTLSGGHTALMKDIVRFGKSNNCFTMRDFSKCQKELTNDPTIKNRVEGIYREYGSLQLPYPCPIYETIIKQMHSDQAQTIFYDEKTHQILHNNSPLDLTLNEFKLLVYFLNNPGKVIEKDEIAQTVWATKEGVSDQAMDKLIQRIRQKIEVNPSEPKILKTIRGRGFQFSA